MNEKMKYQDDYQEIFEDKTSFFNAICDKEDNTQRIAVRSKDVHFYEGFLLDNGQLILKRLLKDASVNAIELDIPEDKADIWIDTIRTGSKIFVELKDENGEKHIIPLSSIAKLSLTNRTTLSFGGDVCNHEISKIALARMYEDLLMDKGPKFLNIIVVYGKVQALMTSRYAPLNQNELFKMVDEKVIEKFSGQNEDTEMQYGFIDHTQSNVTWMLPNINYGTIVSAGLKITDSSTGFTGVILNPVLKFKQKDITFDDGWYSRHVKIVPEDIDTGLDAVYLSVTDNTKKLMDTNNIVLSNPYAYAGNIIDELNTVAKNCKTAKLTTDVKKRFLENVEGVLCYNPQMTVWNIIELLWNIPSDFGQSEKHKESLEKTVSKILALKHNELDCVKQNK